MSYVPFPVDLIGDIHGHADELEAFLKKLGYQRTGTRYKNDEGRTVLFLVDHIDRGPKIKETLALVRGMVEAGNAVALQRISLRHMSTRKTTSAKKAAAAKSSAAARAHAKRFASTFYRKHGAVMSKLSRA